MRAIAILMVLISHSRFLNTFYPRLNSLGSLGFLGVELFFVLSGFLIGSILIKTFEQNIGIKSLRIFWIRRWLRTLPNYYLFLFINIILFWLLNLPIQKIFSYFVFLQNFAWFRPFFFRESWSLAVEEWFYIIYPSLVLIFHAVFRRSVKKTFFLVTILLIVFPMCFRVYFTLVRDYDFVHVRMIVINRLDSMMMGVMMALLKFYKTHFYNKSIRWSLSVAILFTIVVSIILSNSQWVDTVSSRIFLCSLLTLGFACFLPFLDSLKVGNPTVEYVATRLSMWSYSLYLVNLPVEYVLNYLKRSLKFYTLTGNILLLISYWVVSILLSAVIYTFFEKPILKIRDATRIKTQKITR